MQIFNTISDFRAWRAERPAHASIPFVPTMGALHDGHASLVRRARQIAGTAGMVVSSIFVNPTQFGPAEDFARYPRTLDADAELLARAGCDVLFAPAPREMYPGIEHLSTLHSAASTSVDPGPLAGLLEGAIRPGHFRGVCTVVAKLLLVTQPSHLLLGQKDFQQQAILRLMCQDLNFPVEVVTCPTLREPDGLAMSSRNRYLSPEQRPRAIALYEALTWARSAYLAGTRDAALLEAGMHERLAARGLAPEYAHVAHARSLALFRDSPTGMVNDPAVLLIAARLGTTRLIDNMILSSTGTDEIT